MSETVVPNVSLGAKTGDGLTPLNRPQARRLAAARADDGKVYPFDPRHDGNTVEVVDAYLRSLAGTAASSERLRVLILESQQETPRITIRGMVQFLDDGTDEYDVPDDDEEEDDEQNPASAGGDENETAGQDSEQGEEGETSVDGSTVVAGDESSDGPAEPQQS